MKLRSLILFVFISFAFFSKASVSVVSNDSILETIEILDTDSLLQSFFSKEKISGLKDDILSNVDFNPTTETTDTIYMEPKVDISGKDSVIEEYSSILKDSVIRFSIPEYIEDIPHDTILLQANPFFIDLVFKELPLNFDIKPKFDFEKYYFGNEKFEFANGYVKTIESKSGDKIIEDLRQDAYKYISNTNVGIFTKRFDELPDINGVKNHIIETRKLTNIKFVEGDLVDRSTNKLVVKKVKVGPWKSKATTLLQFSQNLVSDNWHQGGNSNMAVLGILTGQLNYDNKKNIQFENYGEWKMGFYYVNDSTALRSLNTNNDVLKLNSKLGFKINNNWFYTGTIDFSTNFLKNYKAVNSDVLKAGFLTPVRINVGVGLDYKYKKMFSLVLSPLSYKYIYLNPNHTNVDGKIYINPNQFGIKDGKNTLSEFGSALKAQLSYSPVKEIQLDSKLSFYTNYEKLEVDWEIVGNFTINRYLSTRLSINPRYDNTVIEAPGEKAKLQFKELLSFGFSYKLLN